MGLSLCRLLAQRGCRLIMSCRTLDELQTAKQDVIKFCASQGLQKAQSDFCLLPFDVSDLSGLDAVVTKAYAYTSNKNIDFLFNNAGMLTHRRYFTWMAFLFSFFSPSCVKHGETARAQGVEVARRK